MVDPFAPGVDDSPHSLSVEEIGKLGGLEVIDPYGMHSLLVQELHPLRVSLLKVFREQSDCVGSHACQLDKRISGFGCTPGGYGFRTMLPLISIRRREGEVGEIEGKAE
jgi:hypothetical protein